MPRHALIGALLLSCLVACEAVGPRVPDPGPSRAPAPGKEPAKDSARPPARPVDPPATKPTAAPTGSGAVAAGLPAGVELLAKPPGATRQVAGTIAIDASYAIGAAGAQLISNNSGSVVAVGGADILGKIRLISDYQGGLTGAKAGNLIASGGDNAGILGKIRSATGIIANHGASYRLAQAPGAQLPIGTTAPSAGMAISVLGLASGELLPLGVDAAGKPVFEVYSDAAGGFELHLPADTMGSVLVAASAPGTTDRRLRYSLLVPEAKPLATAVDEDTNRTTNYMRLACMRAFMGRLGAGEKLSPDPTLFPDLEEQRRVAEGMGRFDEAAKAMAAFPAERREALAGRLGEILLSRLDVGAMGLYREGVPFKYDGPDEPAFAALTDALRKYRVVVTEKMRQMAREGQDPVAYFAGRPYLQAANLGRAVPYEIKRPVDFCDFVIDYFVATSDPIATLSSEGYMQATSDASLAYEDFVRYAEAYRGIRRGLVWALYTNQSGILDEVVKAVEAEAKAP